ncbi:divalent metal cation transporter [Candidatus Nitrosopelagicus sp.]|nr:divalent metal cation transporter [Candidatus Nitrosopelagicus sp.]MDC0202647.1 divalent metal cation transporter [Candidatus Nitrosopelagicus sp.]
MSNVFYRYRKTFGPGILFACTAIGVSHLVQSTRAGAEFGFVILGFVILANVMKYPFFEHGSRYANVTGTSIIDGYDKLGRKFLFLYLGITLGSMFFVTAAVGFVTAGFFENLFQIEFLGMWTMVILFAVCGFILCVGKFGTLDGIIKIIGFVLIISTAVAFILAFVNGPVEPSENFLPRELWDDSGIFFLIALMGWMPTAIDLSSWNSLWTIARIKQTGYRPKLKETLTEFRIGYFITSLLAIFFLGLGTLVFFGSGDSLPNNNSLFAHKIVTMFANTIGQWSYIIIAASAFSVMFGTILAVFDGYSRSFQKIIQLLRNNESDDSRKSYVGIVCILAIGSILIIMQFGDKLKELVDFATTLSFLVAPIIAILNHKLVIGKFLPKNSQPSVWIKGLSMSGIVFLTGFALFFIYTKFF